MYHGERFNSWTHLAGAALALIGALWLLSVALQRGEASHIVSAAVYGGTLVLLYTVSTLYHSVRGPAKRIWQKLDHLAIYLLIAGSYTPFCLISLHGTWGWSMLAIVWTLAVIGMVQELKPRSEARIMSLVIYGLMGWSALIAINPLLERLGTAGFAWLIGGGLAYTGGVVFYALDHRIRHGHGIWHLFVLAGSALHFVAIAGYVLPCAAA
jgi:hemolysin III